MNIVLRRCVSREWLLGWSLLVITGCGAADAPSRSAPGQAARVAKPRVALIMKSLANEFFSTMAKGAEEHQSQHADAYDLIVNGLKNETDLSRQVAIVEEMVANGVDAIVIAPADSQALIPVLKRAQAAGVIVVNIDNRLDSQVLATEGVAIPFVGPDNQAGAQRVAEFLAKKLSQGDAVAILEGVRTAFNSQQRRLGFEQAMSAAGMHLVASQSAQWEMSPANTIAAAMLNEHPEIKAILACNDSMALGAVAAVRGAGREGQVLVVGFDNISAAQESLRDGKLLATADQHADQLAVYGIQYALQLLQDPNAQVEDRETPVDLITAEELN